MGLKPNILVVDDQPENQLILDDLLTDDFVVHAASNGEQALTMVTAGTPIDIILLDVIMPGINGFDVCRRLKAWPHTCNIPVLFLTSLDSIADETEGFSAGGEDFIHKPFSAPVVLARIHTHLQLANTRRDLALRNENLELLVNERTRELIRQKQEVINAQDATIIAFCALAEARDNETGNHIRRTQNYVRILAELMRNHPRFCDELNDDVILQLYKSAPLHDVGKVAIPDAVLNKPGKLTAEEWVIMKQHTEFGRDVIAQVEQNSGSEASFLRYARQIAYSHHEKWDGSGYPQGLAGDAIPASARFMAVADVYDALISRRVYKQGYSHEQAIAIISEGQGRHFDPDIVDALLKNDDLFQKIAQEFHDEFATLKTLT
ncbi:MAG: response regulator [Methylicorpusculum sp.]|uniref:HD domain-containing phosphohydrolase n=1 Tax=Methylicorpusculum sp. TaxID=2713644 RepID=UPI0027247D8B|nr:HD domain-containing phosphohydrolase [Methylicorpusculum sp.]MDO8845776.1 response regulator [Methylicorpusculum sp.]MDO8939423.1 response regulator [Methylicorpusculum sp.]MDO9239172.1 response regulator [Methylicorpusculum sp.]MDP2200801.1 response regulator [Methylicorpusculum sp.]